MDANQNQTKSSKAEFDEFSYLKNQIKYLGFGEDEKLLSELKKEIEGNNGKFALKTTSDKSAFGKLVEFNLNFNKSDKGTFFNSYDILYHKKKDEILSHRFYVNKEKNITAKEAINLLEGRAVKTKIYNKKENSYEPAFIKLKLKEEKTDSGNYQLEVYNKNYGVDTAKILDNTNLIFDKPEYKDFTIKSLEKGNLAPVKIKYNNEEIEGKAMLNPQYKTINLYDNNMNRLNTNKPAKAIELEDNIKANVKEHSIKRSH